MTLTDLPAAPGRFEDVPPPGAGALAAALAPLVAGAADRTGPTLTAVTIPVAPVDPIDVFGWARSLGLEAAIWLKPSDGFGLVAVGSAWAVESSGPDRFTRTAAAWSALLEGAIVAPLGRRRGTGPLLLGGFPFSPDRRPASETWAGFGTGRLVLPELLVSMMPTGTWLTASAVVRPGEGREVVERLDRRWTELVGGGRRDGVEADASGDAAARLRVVAPGDARAWRDAVARLAGAVGRGRLDKVVLARQVDLEANAPIDVAAVLRRLRIRAPESTVFAIGRAGRTFLGATPERLVRSDARTIRTVAMAGSIGRGTDPAEDARLAAELLASDKDREEHAVVVEMVRSTLAPLVEALTVDPSPRVVRLRHVQHLVTRVSGRLRAQAGILELVERLHPTPAVGGAPRDLALELIDEQEGLDRGWYAGPLGWLDRNGEGEFVVAIRSGIVAGRRASLFAGCGIVADSNPEREWEESEIKLRTLASALGEVDG